MQLFRHNDFSHAKQLLHQNRSRFDHAVIATEGIFSMDGDLAPLEELAKLAEHYDAWLLCDDAHGIGVVGNGRGAAFMNGKPVEIALQMGTLSKAIGGYGGYLCASQPVIDLMQNRARTLIYSTGLPPLRCRVRDRIHRCDRERAGLRGTAFAEGAAVHAAAHNCRRRKAPSCRCCWATPTARSPHRKCWKTKAILVIGIRPPTVPEGTARLRFTFTALHADSEIERLAGIVRSRILN